MTEKNDTPDKALVERAEKAADDFIRSWPRVTVPTYYKPALAEAFLAALIPTDTADRREAVALPLVFYDASDPARNVANLADALKAGEGRVSVVGWQKLIADLNASLIAGPPEGWQTIDSAPHACHFLATRFDWNVGERVCGVVMSPPTKPFTHWQMLPPMPAMISARPGEPA